MLARGDTSALRRIEMSGGGHREPRVNGAVHHKLLAACGCLFFVNGSACWLVKEEYSAERARNGE